MSRKLLTALLLIAMVVPAAFAKRAALDQQPVQDNRVQVLMPGTNGATVPTNVFKSMQAKNDGDYESIRIKSPRPAAESALREDDIWQLKHVDDVAEYYLGSGAAADTFAMVFTPAAPAIIQEVYQQWFSPGNAIAFLAAYGDSAAHYWPTGESSTIAGGSTPHSPIGALLTNPTPIVVTSDEQDWTYPMDVGLVDGTDIVIGSESDLTNVPAFVVAFVKGGETPQPLADATSDQGGLTYTWLGGPINLNNPDRDYLWGRYSSATDVMTMVEVTYPYGAPIAVSSLEQKNNTFYTSGPFNVEAVLFDDLDDNSMAISSEDEVIFHWTADGGVTETSGPVTAVETGADGNGTYSYDILGDFEVGDEIEYWITSTDNDGLQAESISLSFEILEAAYPDAELLLIDENLGNDELMIYRAVADAAGIVYEYWSIEENAGIDASVLGYGWENIIHYGWGASSVPMTAGDDDPGYADFLDAGGNYVLIDQDYFYGHTDDPVITFTTGDFAYDYLGLGSGNNDPSTGSPAVSTSDTSFFGIGGTAMDVTFTSEAPYSIDHIVNGTSNWGDDFIPGLGTALFAGTELGLTYGVYYESDVFNTAYLSFMADAAVDTVLDDTDFIYPQFTTLLNGVFDWMGFGSPAQISDVNGPSGTVLSGPYAVSATIYDADDDAITAKVILSADEGETWTEIAMTADGDMYTASIADPITPGMYYWGIVAESGDQSNSYPPANEEAMYFERMDFTPSADVLVVFNGFAAPTDGVDDYPQDYYFGVGDVTDYIPADFAHDVWGSAITADLATFYTTIYEITTNGPNNDNSAVIQAWLAEGAKNYYLVGDEWFYVLGGTEPFAAGDFEYDVLGVLSTNQDISGSGSAVTAIEAVDGNVLSGALYTAHMAAGDTLFYDPTSEIGVSNWMDGFLPMTASEVNMTTFAMSLTDTVYSIGLNREVGDDKIAFLACDPLTIIYPDPYTWWGYAEENLLTQSLAWFGIPIITSVDGPSTLPTEFNMTQNYPNPFNPSTSISFEVPNSTEVLISVYNMLGQKVVDLVNDSYAPGVYNVQWSGMDASGKPVGSGLYIYQMNAGDYSSTNKMLFLK